MKHRHIIVIIIASATSIASCFAQVDLATTEKILDIIARFSISICGNPDLKGSSKTAEAGVIAKAEVSKLVKQLAEIKLETAVKFQNSEYQGLLQQDLAPVLKDSRTCKQSVFNDLKERLLPPPSNRKPIAAADRITVTELECKRSTSPPGSFAPQMATLRTAGSASIAENNSLILEAITDKKWTEISEAVLNCEFWGQGTTVGPEPGACKRLPGASVGHSETSNWFGKVVLIVNPDDKIFVTLRRVRINPELPGLRILLGEIRVPVPC